MTRLFYSKVAIRAVEDAVRIQAGAGYLVESKIQRYFLDAILYRTIKGTTEIQESAISREIELQMTR